MGLFSKFFGKKDKPTKKTDFLNVYSPIFSAFGSQITENNVVHEAVHSITRHASKLTLEHVRLNKEGHYQEGRKSLNYILQYAPNPIESGADLIEKAMYHYLVSNNVFIYLEFDPFRALEGDEVLKGLWVIDPMSAEVFTNDRGKVFLEFYIDNETRKVVAPLENIAHIRRKVGTDDFFGDSNESINQLLRLISTNYQGMEKAIKQSAFLRFIIESTTPMKESDKVARAKQFREDFLDAEDAGGVIFSDTSAKVTPIESKGKWANYKDFEQLKKSIYQYFGTNERIIKADYTDDQWNSFYESSIEPFVNKLELELSKKVFTPTEFAHRNRIRVRVNKLQSMSLKGRSSVVSLMKEVGGMTLNEMRELVYLPPVEGGDERKVSLNYVDSEDQSEYQTGNGEGDDNSGGNSEEEETDEETGE